MRGRAEADGSYRVPGLNEGVWRVWAHASDGRQAIATVEIEGVEPGDLNAELWEKNRIITTPITHEEFRGLRISPSVYTTLEELDRFVDAMEGALS